jgi:quinoprotein glucose dehydrogenase
MDLGKREATAAAEAMKAAGPGLRGSEAVRREATQAGSRLGLKEFGPAMAALVKDTKQPVSLRVEALYAVEALRDPAAGNSSPWRWPPTSRSCGPPDAR